MKSLPEPPTLMSIQLELRQKILLLTLDEDTFFKDIVIVVDELDHPDNLNLSKGPYVKRWPTAISDI